MEGDEQQEVYEIELKCWCGRSLVTDGRRRWCSINFDPKPHDKFENGGRTEPIFYPALPETRFQK